MFMFRTSSLNLVLLTTLFCVQEHVASSPNSTSASEDSAAPAVTTACTGVSPDPPDFLEGEQIGWNGQSEILPRINSLKNLLGLVWPIPSSSWLLRA